MKKFFLALTILLFPLLVGMGQVKADQISIVSDTAYAPFEFRDSDQEYKGIDVDIIKEVAKRKNWDYKMKFPGFDAAVNAVQSGQADAIMAGMTATEERKKVFTMSDTYYDTKVVVATKKQNKVSSYKELKGKKVGVKNGTAAQRFLTENQSKYGYEITTFDTGDLMNNSLNTGAIYAMMDDKPVIEYAINQGQDLRIEMDGESVGSFAFGVKKGSKYEYLIEDFNQALADMKKDGTLEQIIAKWTAGKQSEGADESTVWGLLYNNREVLLKGLVMTVVLTLLSFAIATLIGIFFGMLSVSPVKSFRVIASIFVDLVRGVPLMILAAFIFWGIPNLIESITGQQAPINEFVAGTIALSLNAGAYIAEIVRGGIQAVPVGQMEASRSLGVSYGTTMRKIILPQAGRLMLPNFINQFVITLKDTTIVSAIGLVELFYTGRIIIGRNYQSFRMYAILAVLYLIVITILTRIAKKLEK